MTRSGDRRSPVLAVRARPNDSPGWPCDNLLMRHDDGTVEVLAEGEAESLERFERAIRQGPSRSRVEKVVVDETEPATVSDGFFIR